MLFNSPEFIFVFLPAAIVLHYSLARFGIAAAASGTTIASLAFYAWWNPAFLPLPVLSIALNFLLARQIVFGDKRWARGLVIVGVTANLLVLGYFKYADFLLSIADGHVPAPPNVPLALSFTTFVQIAFLVDVYRRRPPVGLPSYALFVSFFPHLIAGPIVRWSELGPQIAEVKRYRVDWNNVGLGLTIFVFGLGKKLLIADQLSIHVAPVFDAAARAEPVTALAAWGAAFAYSAQLYFDFSGYSEMAVGLGLLFNLRLPINFAAPFRATSVIDLWRRWHVSLSRFLRDFVYVPLGGDRQGVARRSLNLVVTMTLGGLWHGAAWTFIFWGAFHGVLLAVNHAWRSWRGKAEPGSVARFFGWLSTITAFAIGMVLFRATGLGAAGRLLAAMAGFGAAAVPGQEPLEWDRWGIERGYIPEQVVGWFGTTWSAVGSLWTLGALAVALLVPDTMEICDYREGEPHSRWRRTHWRLVWKPSPAWLAAVVILFIAAFERIGGVTEFLYYQF
jgi:D-alanyl-lipoteichoic acid acyltransferase DltB (MBOAT superfamily)